MILSVGVLGLKLGHEFRVVGDRQYDDRNRRLQRMILGRQPGHGGRRLVVQTLVDAGLHPSQREQRNRRCLHLDRQLLDLVAGRFQPIDEDHRQGRDWNRVQHVRRQQLRRAGARPMAISQKRRRSLASKTWIASYSLSTVKSAPRKRRARRSLRRVGTNRGRRRTAREPAGKSPGHSNPPRRRGRNQLDGTELREPIHPRAGRLG